MRSEQNGVKSYLVIISVLMSRKCTAEKFNNVLENVSNIKRA